MACNSNNICSGKFKDTLDLKLTSKCLKACPWCVEQDGYKPKQELDIDKIVDKIIKINPKSIALLGGEPFLYDNLSELLEKIVDVRPNIVLMVTTSCNFKFNLNVLKSLKYISSINISINVIPSDIKDVELENIKYLTHIASEYDIPVRCNCLVTKHFVNDITKVDAVRLFCIENGFKSIRVCELESRNDENFVPITDIYPSVSNINPFRQGCEQLVSSLKLIGDTFDTFAKMYCNSTNTDETDFKDKNTSCINKGVLYMDGVYSSDGWLNKDDIMLNVQELYEYTETDKPFVRDSSRRGCSIHSNIPLGGKEIVYNCRTITRC